jgi:C-terminal processing protease CtpA/Prc
VGARLVRIGNHDTSEVTEQLASLAPRDNESSGLVTIPMMLNLADVLIGVGLIDDATQPGYVLERADGERITLNPTPVAYAEYSAVVPVQWRLPQRESPLSLSRVDEAFWWTTLDDDQVIYVQYNQMTSRSADLTISALRQALQTEMSGQPIRRLILDMRYNSGGDINTGAPFRSFFHDQPLFQQPGGLIVLIGRNTFSAGTVFSLWLEQDVNPVFIGEPTGGRPLMFENARQFTLPNSHLTFQISTRARHDVVASDTRQSIEPTAAIGLSSTDYFAGVDPVLDAALNLDMQAN